MSSEPMLDDIERLTWTVGEELPTGLVSVHSTFYFRGRRATLEVPMNSDLVKDTELLELSLRLMALEWAKEQGAT